MTDEELTEIVEMLRRRGTDFDFVEAKQELFPDLTKREV